MKILTLSLLFILSSLAFGADGVIKSDGGFRYCLLDGQTSGPLCTSAGVKCNDDGTCSSGGKQGKVKYRLKKSTH